jgi:putative salt-induced outer membrane protein YdiY
MHYLYLSDRPDFDGDDELSMIGEFGFLVANGNTDASTITAKIITSQELTSWSYQIIGNASYKQSQQNLDEQKRHVASAQKLFISGQLDHKMSEPDDRLFIYGEYENNRFNSFRYQAALAAGWTSRLWHNKQSEFKYSIGPGYGISEVEDDNSKKIPKVLLLGLRWSTSESFLTMLRSGNLLALKQTKSFTKKVRNLFIN